MTVPSTPSEISYSGDGVSVAFPISFPFEVASDIKVTSTDSAGNITTLTTGFSVAGGGGSTGTLTFLVAPASGVTITIIDDPVRSQTADYENNDAFPADTHERALDRGVRISKRLYQMLRRCVRTQDGDPVTDLTLGSVDNRKGKFLFFNAVTGAIEYALSIGTTVISQSIIGQLLNPQSDEEASAGVLPTNYFWPYGDPRRFGAVLDGVTDDTAALQRWASVTGHHRFPANKTAKITATIKLVSNATYEFAKGACIQTAIPNISLLLADSKTRLVIVGGYFKQTVAGSGPYTGGVQLTNCTYCEIRSCEFEGMQWAGVYLDSSNNCIVADNYFHDFLASAAGDKSDIAVYMNSSFNTISGNRCSGGASVDYGILVQDPGGVGTYLPRYNKVIGNFVSDHKSYGIIFYIGGNQQGNNQCLNNTIQNITGTGIAGNSGTGIYCVGNGLGAQLVSGNLVRNACISTTGASNGPAGISINDTLGGGSKVIVSNNTIEEMSQGHGILLNKLRGGAVCTGNTVRIPNSNAGAGVGGASLRGDGIRVTESDDVQVSANVVRQNGTGEAFFSFATASSNQICVSNNNLYASSGSALRFDRFAAFTHTNCVINNNELRTDGSAALIDLALVNMVTVVGNNGGANTGVALNINACTFARIVGNSLSTNGATGVQTASTCTASYYDKSNRVAAGMVNAATGFRVELVSSTPASGTWAAGDTVWQPTPAAGASPGAICTTSGSPGTWKAMAAIAA